MTEKNEEKLEACRQLAGEYQRKVARKIGKGTKGRKKKKVSVFLKDVFFNVDPCDLFEYTRSLAFYIFYKNYKNSFLDYFIFEIFESHLSRSVLKRFHDMYNYMINSKDVREEFPATAYMGRGVSVRENKICIDLFNNRQGKDLIIWHRTTKENFGSIALPAKHYPPSDWIKGVIRLALTKLVFLKLIEKIKDAPDIDENITKRLAANTILMIAEMLVEDTKSPVIQLKLFADKHFAMAEVPSLTGLLMGSGSLRSMIKIDEEEILDPCAPRNYERQCYRITAQPYTFPFIAGILSGFKRETLNNGGALNDSLDRIITTLREMIKNDEISPATLALLTLSAKNYNGRAFQPLTANYAEFHKKRLDKEDYVKAYGDREKIFKSYKKLLDLVNAYSSYLFEILKQVVKVQNGRGRHGG